MKKTKKIIFNLKSSILNKEGFSLIELVFAMSFLTLIIFGVISLQSSNLALANRQNNQIQANFYANQGLQIIKALGYGSISSNCAAPPCNLVLNKPVNTYLLNIGSKEEIGSVPFERTLIIENPGLTDAYLVRSVIEWTDSTGDHNLADNSQVEAKLVITKP